MGTWRKASCHGGRGTCAGASQGSGSAPGEETQGRSHPLTLCHEKLPSQRLARREVVNPRRLLGRRARKVRPHSSPAGEALNPFCVWPTELQEGSSHWAQGTPPGLTMLALALGRCFSARVPKAKSETCGA